MQGTAEVHHQIADALLPQADLVWSKNSCGFIHVVFQESPEPFTALNRACTLASRLPAGKSSTLPFP